MTEQEKQTIKAIGKILSSLPYSASVPGSGINMSLADIETWLEIYRDRVSGFVAEDTEKMDELLAIKNDVRAMRRVLGIPNS